MACKMDLIWQKVGFSLYYSMRTGATGEPPREIGIHRYGTHTTPPLPLAGEPAAAGEGEIKMQNFHGAAVAAEGCKKLLVYGAHAKKLWPINKPPYTATAHKSQTKTHVRLAAASPPSFSVSSSCTTSSSSSSSLLSSTLLWNRCHLMMAVGCLGISSCCRRRRDFFTPFPRSK